MNPFFSRFLFVAFFCSLVISSVAQNNYYKGYKTIDVFTTKSYGIPTYDGNFIQASSTYGATGDDFFILITDSVGDIVMQKSYDSPLGGMVYEAGRCISQTSDSGFVFTAYGSIAGQPNLFVIRVDKNCDTLWSKAYGEPDSQIASSVIQTSDGGFIITAATLGYGANQHDILVIKTDESGDIQWQKMYDLGGNEDVRAIIEMDSSYVIAASTLFSNMALFCIDTAGTLLWNKTYPLYDYEYDFRRTPDNGFIYCCGATAGIGGKDAILMKLDSVGTVEWSKAYGGTLSDQGVAVEVMDDNGYLLCGTSTSFGSNYSNVYLVRTNSTGDTLWTRVLEYKQYCYGQHINKVSDGVVVGGYVYDIDIIGNILLKFDTITNIPCKSLSTSTQVLGYPVAAGTSSITITPLTDTAIYNPITIENPLLEAIDICKCDTCLAISDIIITDNLCAEGNTGEVTIDVTGGIPPYSYSWSNGGTDSVVTNLTSGWYYVTVNDSDTSSVMDSVEITEPALIQTDILYSNIGSVGGNDGSIDITVSGGTPGYSYSWSTGASTEDINGLSQGWYFVTIMDMNLCIVIDSVKLLEMGFPCPGTDSIQDVDGNWYNTVQIVDQCWMAENLNVGIRVNSVNPALGLDSLLTQTDNGTIEKYCNEDQLDSCNVYGGLYLWDEMMDYNLSDSLMNGSVQGICPVGWHIPTHFEWTTMERALCTGDSCDTEFLYDYVTVGMFGTNEGGKLKETGTLHWNDPNVGATNESGFSAIAGGLRDHGSGIYGALGLSSFMWTSTEWDPDFAWIRYVTSSNSSVMKFFNPKTRGLAVRCLKDVDTLTTMNISFTDTINVSCNGIMDGSAIAVVSGGLPPYSYIWSSGATDSTATGLSAGWYYVTITDDASATAVDSVEITEPTLIQADILYTNIGSLNGDDGAIDLTVSGGNPGYSYNWSTGASTEDINVLSQGWYFVTITDMNICSVVDSVKLLEMGFPCPGADSVQDVDGNWYNTVQIGAQCWMAENLNVGTRVNSINPGLGVDSLLTQTDNGTIEKYCYEDQLDSCNVYGGLYTWDEMMDYNQSDSLMNGTVQGICPTGWHISTLFEWTTLERALCTSDSCDTEFLYDYVTVGMLGTDEGGKLKETGTLHWNNPNVGATNQSGFTARAGGLRDHGPGTYGAHNISSFMWTATEHDADFAWLRFVTSSNASILRVFNPKARAYSVRCLKDIDTLTSMNISISDVIHLSCNGTMEGSANAIVSGGLPPYTYLWSDGSDDSTAVSLAAGWQYVTVTDANTGTVVDSVEITEPPEVILNISTLESSCGINDGSASATVSGGISPYSYQWSNGVLTQNNDGLGAGIYQLSVTDNNGCVTYTNTSVSEVGGPAISVNSVTGTSCYGDYDGGIDISVTGGITPYIYEWSNGQTTEDISGLPSGPHEIIITGADGCKTIESIIVQGPDPLELPWDTTKATCGFADGTAVISPFGGTSPFTYIWSNGTTTSSDNALALGVYIITVTDANGCLDSLAIPISEAGGPDLSIDSIMDVTCGLQNGAIYTTAENGVPPYTFIWSNSNNTDDNVALGTGFYNLTVTGANGCGATAYSLPIAEPPLSDPIGYITVDTITKNNTIMWSQLYPQDVSLYNLYRESSQPGLYYMLASVPFDSLNVFEDILSDPESHAWRYKISTVDICGNESYLSESHKTIHLSALNVSNGVQLIWNKYEGFEYDKHYIYRSISSAPYALIDSVTIDSTTYLDTLAPVGFISYRIEVSDTLTSGGSKAVGTNYNTSRSNDDGVFNDLVSIALPEYTAIDIAVYPNPNNGLFDIEINTETDDDAVYRIYDMRGRIISSGIFRIGSGVTVKSIVLNNPQPGPYLIQVNCSKGYVNKMIIVD